MPTNIEIVRSVLIKYAGIDMSPTAVYAALDQELTIKQVKDALYRAREKEPTVITRDGDMYRWNREVQETQGVDLVSVIAAVLEELCVALGEDELAERVRAIRGE